MPNYAVLHEKIHARFGGRRITAAILLCKTVHKCPTKEAFADAEAMVFFMKRFFLILLLLLTATAFSVALVSCESSATTVPETSADGSRPAAGSTGEETTEKPADNKPAPSLATDKYAQAGLELVLDTIDKYYNLRTHQIHTKPNDGGNAVIWGVASFLEMMAEAYRCFPDNVTIQKVYVDALDRCLPNYRVTNATITPPSGQVYKGMTYYNAGHRGRGDFYYDDNAWICLQLFNAYELLKNDKYLAQAEALLEFFWTGWDEVAGGGIYWSKDFDGKGTCTNAPISICYEVGYQLTKKEIYLEHAKAVYDWEYKYMRDGNGLYAEGVENLKEMPPAKRAWRAAYDQGTMMTSAALLYEITGERVYRSGARSTGSATLNLMFESKNGKYIMKGNPIFKAWCLGWAVRGEMMVYRAGETTVAKNFFVRMRQALDDNMALFAATGAYDPYFGTGDWKSEAVDDILQPTGIATTLLLTGLYNVRQEKVILTAEPLAVTYASEEYLLDPAGKVTAAKAGETVKVRTHPITDADLEVRFNGAKAAQIHADSDYWEYEFVMPDRPVQITFRIVGGQ